MTIKDIINKNGIKHTHIIDKLNVTKGGLHYILNKKMTVSRGNELRNILEEIASNILHDLEKST
jgi:hypothetical protein